MMGGMGMLMILLLGGQFNGLLAHPPRDLASLLEPAAVLQKMEVQTTEDALLAVLKMKANAAPADVNGGDALYVKKLMAIRLLEQTKSKNALPALQDVVKEPDVTLRDAAQEAIAAISGKPNPRPSGAALLKELARSIPNDAGFAAALDMERASKVTTLRMFLESAAKEAEAKGLLTPPAQEGTTPEEAAKMKEQAKKQMKESLEAELTQMTDGLAEALAHIGNLRIDAAALFVSADAGTQPDAGYAAIVFKGLYDPERFAKFLKMVNDEEREVAGRKVFVERETQFCLFDANTLVLLLSPNGMETVHMEKLLRAMTAAEKPAQKATLTAAFDLATGQKMRLAASGVLSPEQKEAIRAELGEADAGDEPIIAAGRILLLSLLPAEKLNAALDDQGKLSAQAAFADKAPAAALADAATKLHQALKDTLAKEAGNMPQQTKVILDPLLKADSWWQTEAGDKTVTLKTVNLMPVITAMLVPIFF